jgi:hypothetical protein
LLTESWLQWRKGIDKSWVPPPSSSIARAVDVSTASSSKSTTGLTTATTTGSPSPHRAIKRPRPRSSSASKGEVVDLSSPPSEIAPNESSSQVTRMVPLSPVIIDPNSKLMNTAWLMPTIVALQHDVMLNDMISLPPLRPPPQPSPIPLLSWLRSSDDESMDNLPDNKGAMGTSSSPSKLDTTTANGSLLNVLHVWQQSHTSPPLIGKGPSVVTPCSVDVSMKLKQVSQLSSSNKKTRRRATSKSKTEKKTIQTYRGLLPAMMPSSSMNRSSGARDHENINSNHTVAREGAVAALGFHDSESHDVDVTIPATTRAAHRWLLSIGNGPQRCQSCLRWFPTGIHLFVHSRDHNTIVRCQQSASSLTAAQVSTTASNGAQQPLQASLPSLRSQSINYRGRYDTNDAQMYKVRTMKRQKFDHKHDGMLRST